MTPDTVHWIALEIRNQRDALTNQEKWARRCVDPQARSDMFERINFWRSVLHYAEAQIGQPGSRHRFGATG